MPHFISELIKVNPAATDGRKGRWMVIAEAYITQNPNASLADILKGLQLENNSVMWGSCKAAIRKLVAERKVVKRWAGNRTYNYTINPEGWLFGHK